MKILQKLRRFIANATTHAKQKQHEAPPLAAEENDARKQLREALNWLSMY